MSLDPVLFKNVFLFDCQMFEDISKSPPSIETFLHDHGMSYLWENYDLSGDPITVLKKFQSFGSESEPRIARPARQIYAVYQYMNSVYELFKMQRERGGDVNTKEFRDECVSLRVHFHMLMVDWAK